MKYDYYVLDVFTRYAGSGNPLAVVMKADGLKSDQMQEIAREFNLSETVFVTQPRLDSSNAVLRIFTPTRELPFAGHPTVGAAVLLGLIQRLQGVRFEENVGTLTCIIERHDKRSGEAHFSLPILPQHRGEAPDAATIAHHLGIAPDDIGFGPFQPTYYSAGLGFYLIPVRDADVLKKIDVERRGWKDVFAEEQGGVYVFTATLEESGNDYAARMFAPELGMSEDPATGSAAAALTGLLAEKGGFADGRASVIIRQGLEMGRPSRISLRFTLKEGKLVQAGIGGDAVLVRQGALDLVD